MNIKEAVIEGLLSRIKISKDLINKEMKESHYDLKRAKEEFKKRDYKWTIIKSYYAMFHSAKALLFKYGYKERKHIGIIIFLENLENEGKIESIYVNDYKSASSARESADYRYSYNEEIAKNILNLAEEFIKKIKKLL